jgi:hypothetical protein
MKSGSHTIRLPWGGPNNRNAAARVAPTGQENSDEFMGGSLTRLWRGSQLSIPLLSIGTFLHSFVSVSVHSLLSLAILRLKWTGGETIVLFCDILGESIRR